MAVRSRIDVLEDQVSMLKMELKKLGEEVKKESGRLGCIRDNIRDDQKRLWERLDAIEENLSPKPYADATNYKKNFIQQLHQLTTATWDGDLISKTIRDELVADGYAERTCGFNFITKDGIEILIAHGILKT